MVQKNSYWLSFCTHLHLGKLNRNFGSSKGRDLSPYREPEIGHLNKQHCLIFILFSNKGRKVLVITVGLSYVVFFYFAFLTEVIYRWLKESISTFYFLKNTSVRAAPLRTSRVKITWNGLVAFLNTCLSQKAKWLRFILSACHRVNTHTRTLPEKTFSICFCSKTLWDLTSKIGPSFKLPQLKFIKNKTYENLL